MALGQNTRRLFLRIKLKLISGFSIVQELCTFLWLTASGCGADTESMEKSTVNFARSKEE